MCQSLIPAKAVASITGKIILMSLALGDIAWLRTRALYADIHSRSSWQGTITLTADAKEDLNFWLDFYHTYYRLTNKIASLEVHYTTV